MKNNSLRFRGTMALSLSAAALALAIPAAHADRIDLGLFGGIHAFSYENELGSRDIPDNDTIVGALDIGLRVGYGLTRLLSVEGARADYGVVVREDGTADEAATEQLRQELRSARTGEEPFFDRGPGYATLSGGAAFNEFDLL